MARELSARDQELVSFAFQCMLEKPQVSVPNTVSRLAAI